MKGRDRRMKLRLVHGPPYNRDAIIGRIGVVEHGLILESTNGPIDNLPSRLKGRETGVTEHEVLGDLGAT